MSVWSEGGRPAVGAGGAGGGGGGGGGGPGNGSALDARQRRVWLIRSATARPSRSAQQWIHSNLRGAGIRLSLSLLLLAAAESGGGGGGFRGDGVAAAGRCGVRFSSSSGCIIIISGSFFTVVICEASERRRLGWRRKSKAVSSSSITCTHLHSDFDANAHENASSLLTQHLPLIRASSCTPHNRAPPPPRSTHYSSTYSLRCCCAPRPMQYNGIRRPSTPPTSSPIESLSHPLVNRSAAASTSHPVLPSALRACASL